MSKANGNAYQLVAVDKLGSGLEFVDPSTKKSIKRLSLPARPHEIVVSADKKLAYVTIYGDGIYGNNTHRGHQLAVIDLTRREKVGEIELNPFQAPHGLAIDGQGILWASCDKSQTVVAVDPKTGKILDAINTGTDGCHWIVPVAGGSKLYTSNKDTWFVRVIDTKQRTLAKRIEVPNGTEGICCSPDGKTVYASDHKLPKLLTFDTAKDEVTQTVDLCGYGEIPMYEDHEMRVRTTLDGRYVMISGYKWNVAVIVNAANQTEQTLLKTKVGPMGWGFPPFDTNLVYLADHDSSSISIIDLTKKEFVDSFPCGKGVEVIEFIPAA